MKLDDLVDERQADTAALVTAPARVLHAMEALEHARQLIRRDADTGVADRHLHRRARVADAHRDLAFERELESVRQQIENDLVPHLAIDVDRIGKRLAIDDEADARALASRAEVAGKVFGQCAQIRRFVSSLRAAGFDAREVQQRIHKPQ